MALHVLFQRQAEKALQLVDKGCIKKLVGATSGRAVFQVTLLPCWNITP